MKRECEDPNQIQIFADTHPDDGLCTEIITAVTSSCMRSSRRPLALGTFPTSAFHVSSSVPPIVSTATILQMSCPVVTAMLALRRLHHDASVLTAFIQVLDVCTTRRALDSAINLYILFSLKRPRSRSCSRKRAHNGQRCSSTWLMTAQYLYTHYASLRQVSQESLTISTFGWGVT
jgi:hypothetical protein